MGNLFTDDAPEGVPEKLTLDTFWRWIETDLSQDYPTASYTLSYEIFNPVSGNNVTITATKVDGVHTIEADAPDIESGTCEYKTLMTRDVDSKVVQVSAGYTKLGSKTPEKSYNVQVLEAVRAAIAKTATKTQMQYSVNGMQVSQRSPKQLLDLEKEFAKRVDTEMRNLQREAGGVKSSSVFAVMKG